MEIRPPLENDFTLARYRPHEKFLARAFELCQRFKRVSKETRIPQLPHTFFEKFNSKPQFDPKDLF
jgi:hypothetical protein